jgi:hypothetical protein
MIRGLPLLLSGRPGTPLRVLCIVAFDTLHVLRRGKRLPAPGVNMLAALLDFGACANAAFDHKDGSRPRRCTARQLLEGAGIGSSVAEYLRQLGELEGGRPRPGGDRRQFEVVRRYREAVVRLSLGMVATVAGGGHTRMPKTPEKPGFASNNAHFRRSGDPHGYRPTSEICGKNRRFALEKVAQSADMRKSRKVQKIAEA